MLAIVETRPTYTEQYRHQCEIEYVASKDPKWIKKYLLEVARIRGDIAGMELRQGVIKEWKRLKTLSGN